jgi:hypothetical protein
MSPHVEYWGIPSPTEELYCTSEIDFPVNNGETVLAGGSQSFDLDIDCCEEDEDFIPESFE